MTFVAMYAGECNECGADIEPGDEIGYVNNAIACETCVDSDLDLY